MLSLQRAELSVLIAGSTRVRGLNRSYRGIDHTTDVLSFPLYASWREFPKEGEFLLGDVVIDAGRASQQAHRYGLTVRQELQRLLVHGIVHLMGYDHERNAYQARKMKELEEGVLRELPGSYLRK